MSGPLPELRAAELDLLAAVDRSRRRDESIAAWRRWAASIDIDRVDAGTFELLPRLPRRLEELGATAVLPAPSSCAMALIGARPSAAECVRGPADLIAGIP